MRVISGKVRGRFLKVPRSPGTRPATDRMRESLFSILGTRLNESRVLDLFAGSGSFGIEALSRGAAYCLFVDISRACTECIRENLTIFDRLERRGAELARVVRADAFRLAGTIRERFDVCFLDPPYALSEHAKGRIAKLISELLEHCDLVVYHHPKKHPPADGPFEISDYRTYGQAAVSFLRRPRAAS